MNLLEKGYGILKDGFGRLKDGFGVLEKGFGRLKKGFSVLEKGFGVLEKGFGMLKKGFGRLKGREFQVIVCCIFLLFFYIGLLMPYTGDDWAWGTSIGLERLAHGFANYNGRWAGNLLVMAITRSRFLRALCCGASLSAIAAFSAKLVGTKEGKGGDYRILLLITGLLLCIPSSMSRQVLFWAAGFANYTASVAVLLTLAYKIKRILEGEQISWPRAVPWVILCFIGHLFVEHITIFAFIMVGGANLFYMIKHKKVNPLLVYLFAAAVVGAFLMFYNGAYAIAASDGATYQRIVPLSSGFFEMLIERAGEFCPLLLTDNLILVLALSGLGVLVLFIKKPKLYIVPVTILALFVLYRLCWRLNLQTQSFWNPFWEVMLCAAFFLSVAYAAASGKWLGMLGLGAVLMLTAPLLLAKPVGSRNFFVTYVGFAIVCAELLRVLMEHPAGKKARRTLTRAMAVLCVLCAFFYSGMITYIHSADTQRVASVRAQAEEGAAAVTLERLPFEEYLHMSSPGDDIFRLRFRLFYNLPEDIGINVVNRE